jgi:glycerol-3-phosphate acyltransferase PlsX
MQGGNKMQIVLDAMGSDNHPIPEIDAAIEAYSRWGEPLLLTGPENQLRELYEIRGGASDTIIFHDAPEVLEMTDKPAVAARTKSRNSMAVGMELIRTNQAQAFITAGNTGGAMANALFKLGRISGVKRPALFPTFPVRDGVTIVGDIGANADCKPEYIEQFAHMGTIYVETLYGKQDPRVALLSNGEEPGKGNDLIKTSFPLLEKSDLNFIGNVEPKELYAGHADVVITDGFVGNVFLKTSEALSKFLIEMITESISKSLTSSIGGLLARPAFREVKAILDPSEYGAVPLLGVNGLVFIGHGSSSAKALVSAIRFARQAVESDLLTALEKRIKDRLT